MTQTETEKITKLLVFGDPARYDADAVDCTQDDEVPGCNDAEIEHLRDIARAISPPHKPINIVMFRTHN